MKELVEPNYAAETSTKLTVVHLAKRTGLSERSVQLALRGHHLTVERWWLLRWAMNMNASGHYCFEHYALEFSMKLRRLVEGRFGSATKACEALSLNMSQFGPMMRGQLRPMTYFVAYCDALGIAMPSWQRHESIDFLGHHDDRLTSPPTMEVAIPRGLLRAGMTTDHIRVWLVLPQRDTPRSIALRLGIPSGLALEILMELERDGYVVGEHGAKLDFSRRYQRLPTFPAP